MEIFGFDSSCCEDDLDLHRSKMISVGILQVPFCREWHRVDSLRMDEVDMLITSVTKESAIGCVRILEIGALRAISYKHFIRT